MNRNKQGSLDPELEAKKIDDFLWKKLGEAADEWEQELNSKPELDDVEPSPELFEKLMKEIEQLEKMEAAKAEPQESMDSSGEPDAGDESEKSEIVLSDSEKIEQEEEKKIMSSLEDLLSEEDRLALEIGRKKIQKKKWRRKYRRLHRGMGVVAAVLCCVLIVGVSSEANRIRISNLWNEITGKEEVLQFVNNENAHDVNLKEREDREKIKQEIGIAAIEFGYKTRDLFYQNCKIEKEVNRAWMYYAYGDQIVSVMMRKEGRDMAYGEIQDGNIVEEFTVQTRFGDVEIQGTKGNEKIGYEAEFIYEECYYHIAGCLPKEELIKMIEYMVI